jgi:hypothetical protein
VCCIQGTRFVDLRAAKLLKVIKFVVDGARLRVLQVERVQEGQKNFVNSQEPRMLRLWWVVVDPFLYYLNHLSEGLFLSSFTLS